jgi:hypothetical protein
MRRRALLLALPVGAAGCGTPPQTAALRGAAPDSLPRRAELESVPFFPQTRDHCGPAALATVLAHQGLAADPQQLGDAIYLPGRRGTLQLELLGGARRAGAVPTPLPGELAALLREIAAGHPVLLLQNRGLAVAPVWHYAVLVGYDLDVEETILRSATERRERMSLRTFELIWARAGHWAVAVLLPGRLPVTATEAEALQAAIGFERTAPAAQAAAAYRAVRLRWPGNLVAAIGLGNTLAAAGALDEAAAEYRDAAARHDSAMAWINLAELERKRGRSTEAREAAWAARRRAQQHEPQWLEHAERLYRELTP